MESGTGAFPRFKCWSAAVNSLYAKLLEILIEFDVVILKVRKILRNKSR